jgi:nicotinate-nucleotide adenylyltransferase
MLAQIVQRLDSTRYVFLTGGTDHGVEKMLHRLARENEFKVLGFIHEGAIPGEINLVRHVVLAGARNQWVDPLLAALNVAKHKGGFAVFVGGGGVVKQGIDYAAASGIDYFLMRRDPTLEGGGTGGASAEAAPKLDAAEQRQRVFSSTCDLLDLVKRRSLAVFRTPKAQTKPLRIGVYTGSFDPVHKGHQAVVERMWTQYDLDLVYVIPDKVTSYKRMESVENRSQMVARQFRDQTWVRILPSEMQAAIGKGEMWDILRVVQQHHADAEIFNIIGSDTFAWYSKLPLEHRVPEINMLINDRHDGVVLPNTFDGKPVQNITDLDQGLSSTKVREKIRRGETPEELCAEVWKYIRDHGLYLVG